MEWLTLVDLRSIVHASLVVVLLRRAHENRVIGVSLGDISANHTTSMRSSDLSYLDVLLQILRTLE